MGGRKISGYLYKLASELEGIGAVVECGSWLGASCAPVAMAMRDRNSSAPIHCFDRWEASFVEVARVENLNLDFAQDLSKIFLGNISAIYSNVIAHKGELLNSKWDGSPVELQIDDANKGPREFYHMLRTFGPSWIPGKTKLVLMDYCYYEKQKSGRERREFKCQKDFIDEHAEHFEMLESLSGTSGVSFRYVKEMDFKNCRPSLMDCFVSLFNRRVRRLKSRKATHVSPGSGRRGQSCFSVFSRD